MNSLAQPIHVVHVVYGFSIGGLENVVVQLINRLPEARFRHTVIALTSIGESRQRVVRSDVEYIGLAKPPGHAFAMYPRVFRLLRALRPDVVHTCNLAALEMVPIAWAAGVPLRIHAEHGWDAHDPNGSNPRYRLLRRLYRPFVSRYVAVSKDIDDYLAHAIGVPAPRRTLIANGVDTHQFSPPSGPPDIPQGFPFRVGEHWLVGTVGRMQTVKNQPHLARAFVRFVRENPSAANRARLIMVGDGPLLAEVKDILEQAGMGHLAWLAGSRQDVSTILKCLNCFVLPSLAEGTSCTLQEAMACGLPVIATAVGGTPDLFITGVSGTLVNTNDESQLSKAIQSYFDDPDSARAHGLAARASALERFDIGVMVNRYHTLFGGGAAPER